MGGWVNRFRSGVVEGCIPTLKTTLFLVSKGVRAWQRGLGEGEGGDEGAGAVSER
jgi:hypothetical protein